MIKIRMYQNNWIIEIGDEQWRFENIEGMKVVLFQLLQFKDQYGKWKYEKTFN